MSSNRFSLQLTFAFFAFATGSVSKIGSTAEKDHLHEFSLMNLYEAGYLEACDYTPYWSIPLKREVTFIYYTKEYPEGRIFDLDNQPASGILDSTETKILTHGFRGDINSTDFQTVIAAYLKWSKEVNLLALNWIDYTSEKYRDAAKAAISVGKAISSIFCVLYKFYDIYPYQMHFIGHNLGAHLLAAAARESRTRVGRITGLDPARLCFEDHCENFYYPQLTKNDAKFVDILHTDAGNSGILSPQGTADFYANAGVYQPMCHRPHSIIPVEENCESVSAYLYYAESILIPESFYGSRCDVVFPILTCNESHGSFWGEHMETTARGVYSFNTRGKIPYGEGKNDIFRNDN